MAKSSVSDWDTTANNNTDVGNVGIAGLSSIRLGDNAIREMMAQIASYTRAGADLASASTLNLDSVDSLWLAVTGTTTVTAVTLTEGHVRFVRATGAFQITAGASLIVNGSTTVNYTCTAGDLLMLEGFSGGVVHVWVISGAPASQLEQEAGSITNKFVTPGRQQFHPSAVKAWIKASSNGAIYASYNVSSITDAGTGDLVVSWDVDFFSSAYAVVVSVESSGNLYGNLRGAVPPAAGSARFAAINPATGVLDDPNFYYVMASGDQ